jgi:hypothetical protein
MGADTGDEVGDEDIAAVDLVGFEWSVMGKWADQHLVKLPLSGTFRVP